MCQRISIKGWLSPTAAVAMIELLWLQERHGITGNIAEIGIFQGKSFLALAAGAAEREKLFAVDIFSHPAWPGYKEAFQENLEIFFPCTPVTIIEKSSTELSGQEEELGLVPL